MSVTALLPQPGRVERLGERAQRRDPLVERAARRSRRDSVVTPASASACSRSAIRSGGPSSDVRSMNSNGTAAAASRCCRAR